jgi:ketosteroid isomerase-like protein
MARHHLAGVTLAACSLAVGGCGAAPGSETASSAANVREAAVATLRAADSTLQMAVEAKDAERTAALYMADATLLPIAEPAVVGRAAIQQAWASVYGIPGFRNRARITRLEVAAGGDLGFTQGTYEATMTGADGRPWSRAANG